MNKFSLLIISSVLFTFTSCEQKPAESTNDPAKDSIKTVAAPEAQPEVQLSGKASMVAKSWKASEFETPSVKLSGELIDIQLTFKADQTFDYSEDGKKQSGKWMLNKEETILMLEYSDARKVDYDIKELKEDKLIIAGKEHGMYRTISLAPKK